jgi:plastocyanin
MARRKSGLTALLGAFALAASAGAASDPGAQIAIRNFQFLPATIEIHAGDTITWENGDEEIHSIVSSQGLFTSPGLEDAQRFSFRFDRPGTYEYRCALHPQMKGTVVVR